MVIYIFFISQCAPLPSVLLIVKQWVRDEGKTAKSTDNRQQQSEQKFMVVAVSERDGGYRSY